MEKKVESWSVKDLWANFSRIDFPEYQREPNLWSLVEKQRLIDSMVRRFDIASLYFYRHDDGSIDCVDGRQRIGAIISFLGVNQTDVDANFRFRHLNEVYEDSPAFEPVVGMTCSEIRDLAEKPQQHIAQEFMKALLEYPLTVVMLSDSKQSEEFNLQFTRLNLGTIINSGEKLHAMVGDLRNECFEGIGKHAFLEETNIPTRRFAREQVAAQILAQVFSLSDSDGFTRTRHFDLQGLFKRNSRFTEEQRTLVKQVSELLDALTAPFSELKVLRNRAITVSTVLLAWKRNTWPADEAAGLAKFIDEFVHRLMWQIRKGLFVDPEYHYLTEFQRTITQASAESSSVLARANMLESEFSRWLQSKELRGDADWRERHSGADPSVESRTQAGQDVER